MKRYTVKQLGRLSGVSVRTLHHYDEIGLLKPAEIGENGYCYYGRDELLRLQQILFYRELTFPLVDIRALLASPAFDRAVALRAHRARLGNEVARYRRLIRTIDDTLDHLEGARPMEDEALYQGFSPEKQADYENWLVDRYGAVAQGQIDVGKARMLAWSEIERREFLAELADIEAEMGQALADGAATDGGRVRSILRRHHAWIGKTWPKPPTAEAYVGLADLYLAHSDFRDRYEAIRPGLAGYLASAMRDFARRELENNA